jgi:hypothetical protein
MPDIPFFKKSKGQPLVENWKKTSRIAEYLLKEGAIQVNVLITPLLFFEKS